MQSSLFNLTRATAGHLALLASAGALAGCCHSPNEQWLSPAPVTPIIAPASQEYPAPQFWPTGRQTPKAPEYREPSIAEKYLGSPLGDGR